MRGYAFGYTVACLLALLGGGEAVPTNGSVPAPTQVITYEEYVIEHEISTEQARNAAMAIDLDSAPAVANHGGDGHNMVRIMRKVPGDRQGKHLSRRDYMDMEEIMVEVPPGCQKCTSSEMSYCQGRDFINDHCCCDKRYHELLPYIPHTCYLGTQLCKPVVGHCSTYHNIRKCCCNLYVIKKWKSSAPISHRPATELLLLFLITTLLR